MSQSRKADKRKSTPAQKFDERKYYLVQFVEDNVKIIVTENEIKEEDDKTVALYSDKNYYPCVVLAENEDKDVLLKIKHTMVKGKQQKRKGNGKEEGQKEKKRSRTKAVTAEKQDMEKEKEQKKKEKEQKKRALDERDLNILSRMSQLNIKSNDFKDREEELEKRLRALERRQSELNVSQNDSDIFIQEMVVPIPDPTEDIDVSKACNIFGSSTPVRPGSLVSFEGSRPTVAEKRPRAIFLQQKNSNTQACERCDDLLAQLEELKEVNKLLTDRLNSLEGRTGGQTPKPGKVSEAVAKIHNMVELSPKSNVYVYQHHLQKASAKKTESATALFLLSCFYSNADLIGKSLSGIGGKPKLDEHIICSILSYTMAKHSLSTDGPLTQAIRKKITSLESMNKKKEHNL